MTFKRLFVSLFAALALLALILFACFTGEPSCTAKAAAQNTQANAVAAVSYDGAEIKFLSGGTQETQVEQQENPTSESDTTPGSTENPGESDKSGETEQPGNTEKPDKSNNGSDSESSERFVDAASKWLKDNLAVNVSAGVVGGIIVIGLIVLVFKRK